MISHDDFALFEQRPHGLMEVVVPGDSWLFGTVLPWRVNWSTILREFIAPLCPLGMEVERLEFHLSGVPLTEQLVDCWHGFYARVILTFRGAPTTFLLPCGQLWAPLPHLHHEPVIPGASQHLVFVPGGTSLLFSYTFMARGNNGQWFDWLPLAVQASVLLVRPIACHTNRGTGMPYWNCAFCTDSGCDPCTFSTCHCGQDLLPTFGKSGCYFQPW